MSHSNKRHQYQVQLKWTGNTGQGTASYRAYRRSHEITSENKPVLLGSSDPAFRGDPTRYNPEELLVASLSACHMLWYLHLCSEANLVVLDYVDSPTGSMIEAEDGAGRFTEVMLRPAIVLQANSDLALAAQLHDKAHHFCFIANSVNFPVRCEATFQLESVL